MRFLKSIYFQYLSLINISIIVIFFVYSIFIIRYQYDGHHIGLIYSNSIDLIQGKIPYKEIFIQYGILTTLINSLILMIFDNKIFFISFFNSMFYSLGILFFSITVRNFTNLNFSILSTLIILLNHPIPWLPWPNYIAFFFLSISFYFISTNKNYYFLVGFFLGLSILSRQDLFIPLIASMIIFFIFYFYFKNSINYKKIIFFILGFMIPQTVFLIYLIYTGILDIWIDYLSLPAIYLERYKTNISELIFNFILFFSSESFFSFIIIPQYFLISVILIFNSITLFLYMVRKIKITNKILFILIVSNLLSALSLNIELFRLYSSVIFGSIALLYVVNRINDKDLKKKMILLLFLPSIFSFCFYPLGNNHLFKKLNFTSTEIEMKNRNFVYNIWPKQKVKIINILTDLSQKCDVKYLENLTWDTMYSTIGNYDRISVIPYASFISENLKKLDLIENNKNPERSIFELINDEIINSNIILLITGNNNIFNNETLKINSNYNVLKINESDVLGKPKLLRIYFPDKCVI